MIFKLDVAWDSRSNVILWSFVPQDHRAEGLLERLGFRDVFNRQAPLTFQGLAAVAAGRMLRACGARFSDKEFHD